MSPFFHKFVFHSVTISFQLSLWLSVIGKLLLQRTAQGFAQHSLVVKTANGLTQTHFKLLVMHRVDAADVIEINDHDTQGAFFTHTFHVLNEFITVGQLSELVRKQ